LTTTPNLALPYPELTDTADVPRDIKALADKLDALLGGGSGGGGGTGTVPLAAAPVLNVGQVGQIRAGRQLSVADFTSLGLSSPIGLWNLSNLTNLGSDGRPLVNLGAVPFDTGINGLATTAARFSGSIGQALYTVDSGAADPFRIRTGSWGCWFRTAKRGVTQYVMSKVNATAVSVWGLALTTTVAAVVCDGTTFTSAPGVSDVCDDRWHFVVGTADGTTVRCYIDGVLEGTLAFGPLNATGGSAPVNIGGYGADSGTAASSPHFGRVDEAFVTADILTEDQIRLLYAVRLSHTLGTIPTAARLAVHRRRKGSALAVADFSTQPIRLHNFTAGALTDQGSGGVALTNNNPATVLPVAGADGTLGNAFTFNGIAGSWVGSTDTGLPGGLTARSYGCWFKTASGSTVTMMAWGTINTGDARMDTVGGPLRAISGGDVITGPFISDGQWHQAIVTEDNTAGDLVKRKLYVDGRLVGGSTVMTSLTLAGANSFRIGAASNASAPFTGQIDGAFVTGYAMTTQEVLGLYAKGSQDLGASPKNAGDHVERLDAASVLAVFDTLESQHTVDLGVVA
jgi:hypothetical protein